VANTFLKPTVINRMALKLLQREVVLPRLVWNFADAEFRGAYGDTVTLRLPAVLAAREYGFRNNRSSEIVIDDLTETSVPVVLDTDLYSAVALTDEQLTLDIVDFSEQVLNPQVSAIARGLEDLIVETMQSATYGTSLNIADSADGMWGTLLDARKALNDANVPREGRVVVVGSEIEREILSDDKFNRVDSVGDGAVSAVREATINRLAGFTIVGSNAIDAETAIAFPARRSILSLIPNSEPTRLLSNSSAVYCSKKQKDQCITPHNKHTYNRKHNNK